MLEGLLALSVLVVPPYAWWVLVKNLKVRGYSGVVRHFLGATYAITAFMFCAVALAVWKEKQGVTPTFFYVSLVILTIWFHRRATPKAVVDDENRKMEAKADWKIASEKFVRAGRDFVAKLEQADRESKERANQRAAIAREKEALRRMASVAVESETENFSDDFDADTPPSPRRNRRRLRAEGGKLDTIQFMYMDSKGDITERRVVVRVIDEEYFEGRCLTRQAMRTFRLDGIIGDVVSENTGEVMGAEEWAAQFR